MPVRRVISIVVVSDIPKEHIDVEFGPIRRIAPYQTGEGTYEFEVSHNIDALKASCEQNKYAIELGIQWVHNTKKNPFANELFLNIPEQDSLENILNALNDDCLEAIFACGVLDQYDLSHIVPMVCKRFKPIAKMVFKSKYCRRNNAMAMGEMNSAQRIWQFPEYLRTFGNTITRMNAVKMSCFGGVLNLIEANCSKIIDIKLDAGEDGTNLTPFQLRDKMFPNEVCSLMMRAEKLHLSDNIFDGEVWPLLLPEIACEKLVDITLNYCYLFDDYQLGELQYSFFALNPQIKRVSFVRVCEPFLLETNFTKFLPSLEVLYIAESGPTCRMGTFAPLKRLREFRIHDVNSKYSDILPLLQDIKVNQVPLECLTINCVDHFCRIGLPIDSTTEQRTQKAVDIMCSIPTLNSIEIHHISSVQMMQIVRRPNLRRVTVHSSWKFGFDAIVTLLRECNNRSVDVVWVTEYHDSIWSMKTLNTIDELLKTSNMKVRIKLLEPPLTNIDRIVDRYSDWLTSEKNNDLYDEPFHRWCPDDTNQMRQLELGRWRYFLSTRAKNDSERRVIVYRDV